MIEVPHPSLFFQRRIADGRNRGFLGHHTIPYPTSHHTRTIRNPKYMLKLVNVRLSGGWIYAYNIFCYTSSYISSMCLLAMFSLDG